MIAGWDRRGPVGPRGGAGSPEGRRGRALAGLAGLAGTARGPAHPGGRGVGVSGAVQAGYGTVSHGWGVWCAGPFNPYIEVIEAYSKIFLRMAAIECGRLRGE